MDRTTAVNTYYAQRLNLALLGVMEVMQPGKMLEWGAKKHPDLVGLVACQLAVEYEALTGLPIVEMLNDAGATTVPAIELPARPAAEVVAEVSAVVPMSTPSTDNDALPL